MAGKICPNCGGRLVKEDGAKKCINCGYTRVSPAERHAFITANAKEIAKDYKLFSPPKTSKKWGISLDTLYKLPEVREIMKQRVIGENGELPSLPVFSNEWASEVQLKWLEIWEKLKGVMLTK